MIKIDDFLDDNGFSLNIDKKEIVNNFIKDMTNKLDGKKSSLGMLNSFIKTDGSFKRDEPVIVIDAGGTNLRVSTIIFDNEKKPIIKDFKKVLMPGVTHQVSREQFYREIAEFVIPYNNFSNRVGLCFSYPVKLINSEDGEIVRMGKEIKAPDIVGTLVCKSLNEQIELLGGDRKQFTILNDSTATLLAGMSALPEVEWDSYIGYILGTGSNSCYIEDYIINVESGWFDGLPRGRFDKELDENSLNPGTYMLEKSTSGAYLGQLSSYVFKELYRKKIIHKEPKNYTTIEINNFLKDPLFNGLCLKEDIDTYIKVIDRIFERSALNVAINLSALIIKSNRGKETDKPICIAADGSTFYNLKDYQKRVEKYLDEILDNKHFYKFVKVENAPVIGAAIAALQY